MHCSTRLLIKFPVMRLKYMNNFWAVLTAKKRNCLEICLEMIYVNKLSSHGSQIILFFCDSDLQIFLTQTCMFSPICCFSSALLHCTYLELWIFSSFIKWRKTLFSLKYAYFSSWKYVNWCGIQIVFYINNMRRSSGAIVVDPAVFLTLNCGRSWMKRSIKATCLATLENVRR